MRSWTFRHRIGRTRWVRVHVYAHGTHLFVASLTDYPEHAATGPTLAVAFNDLIRRVRPLRLGNHSASG